MYSASDLIKNVTEEFISVQGKVRKQLENGVFSYSLDFNSTEHCIKVKIKKDYAKYANAVTELLTTFNKHIYKEIVVAGKIGELTNSSTELTYILEDAVNLMFKSSVEEGVSVLAERIDVLFSLRKINGLKGGPFITVVDLMKLAAMAEDDTPDSVVYDVAS